MHGYVHVRCMSHYRVCHNATPRSGAMREAATVGADTDAVGFTDRAARGDCILFLHPDDPPASSSPWIDAVNALAALQHALAKVATHLSPFFFSVHSGVHAILYGNQKLFLIRWWQCRAAPSCSWPCTQGRASSMSDIGTHCLMVALRATSDGYDGSACCLTTGLQGT